MRSRAVFPIVALATIVAPALAIADELAPLERPGRVVVGFGGLASRTHLHFASANGGGPDNSDGTVFVAGGRVEVFVVPRVTVGGGVDVWYTHAEGAGGSGHSVSATPTLRLGVYVPLSDRVGFWPYLFGGVSHVDPFVPTNTWFAGASARFVLRFDEHWFLVAEPIQASYARASVDSDGGTGPSLFGFGGVGLRSGLGLGLAM